MQNTALSLSQAPRRVIALIVAAGESRRAGGDIPKQYQMLDGKSLLRRSIEAFLSHPQVTQVQVVIHPTHGHYYAEHTRGLPLLPHVTGGTTRQESVRQGLLAIEASNEAPDYVLIHDAARPNVAKSLITQAIAALGSGPAVIPALPVIDTLKHVERDRVVGTIERKKLFRAQTPQGFHFSPILDAHKQCSDFDCTDDAAVAEHAGMEVTIMQGSEHNYKITTAEDMRDAEALLSRRYETRVGMGFDAHRFVEHDQEIKRTRGAIMLCGIEVVSALALEGHSDADVGLHALVDALLGAMSEGDIGMHFPPSDPRWRGVSSSRFVLHALQILKSKQGRLLHADITVICERPHIAPYRQRMVDLVAELLGIDANRVSIKATTTEKMGFTGRGEGMAAQAVVTIELPAS